jgi:Fur family ferric uptake transcriptional regulator
MDHSHEVLARAGHRSGAARNAVIDLLGRQECCLSAQEIYDLLRAEGERTVGLASVYRAVDLLAGLELLQRVDLGDDVARYEPTEPTGAHHHHLVCLDCGRVRPFEDARLERALAEVAEAQRYAMEGHDVVLRGRCPVCQAA